MRHQMNNWKEYAAITRKHFGKGQAVYIGCMTDEFTLKSVFQNVLQQAGVRVPEYYFPIIVRKGLNDFGKIVRYFFNYSDTEKEILYSYKTGTELLNGTVVDNGTKLKMCEWDVKIVEENEKYAM